MNNRILLTSLVLGITLLSACGSNDQPVNNPYLINGIGQIDGCGAAPANLLNSAPVRVTGDLGNGATLVLDIVRNSDLNVRVFGKLSIPSMRSLWGYSQGLAGYSGGGGGIYGNSAAPVIADDQVSICLDSNNYPGTYEFDSAISNLNISFRNGGIYVEMGSRVGVEAYTSGRKLQGNIYLETSNPNFPPGVFFLQ